MVRITISGHPGSGTSTLVAAICEARGWSSLNGGDIFRQEAKNRNFSLGEFGASWILLRSGSWDTLPILVDQLMARPKYFQLVEPVAMATASLLMMITFVLFVITERFREHQGGGF